jgi:primosomal replication protein N
VKRNEVAIDGRVVKRGALRHTPAGIPAISLVIGHQSVQVEAGGRREVWCEVEAVAIGELAVKLDKQNSNQPLQFRGFLTRRSVKDRRLVLHVTGTATVGNGTE